MGVAVPIPLTACICVHTSVCVCLYTKKVHLRASLSLRVFGRIALLRSTMPVILGRACLRGA